MAEMTPQKRAAKELMLRRFERIGQRYHQHVEEQYELLSERQELEELWRMAGFGDPPTFRPSVGELAGKVRVTA